MRSEIAEQVMETMNNENLPENFREILLRVKIDYLKAILASYNAGKLLYHPHLQCGLCKALKWYGISRKDIPEPRGVEFDKSDGDPRFPIFVYYYRTPEFSENMPFEKAILSLEKRVELIDIYLSQF